LTIKSALEIKQVGQPDIALAISTLQNLCNLKNDTVNVTVNFLDKTGEIAYTYICQDCFLVKFEIDSLDRQKGDDKMVQATLTFSPSYVKRLTGPQITG
jgi:hypothetical protein